MAEKTVNTDKQRTVNWIGKERKREESPGNKINDG